MHKAERIEILGCPIDAVSLPETVARIRKAVLSGTRLKIATANVDFVMKAKRDGSFARDLWDADLVVADGVPLLWAAAVLGKDLRGRVNGTDLVLQCSAVSAETGCHVALVGAGPGVVERAAERLREISPKATMVAIPTPYPLNDESNREVIAAIRRAGAHIVLVALGAPLQERWIKCNLEKCGANVGIGIGSSFDIICGDKPRAPEWMRERGLEWLHRLRLEPRRLGKRYLIEDAPFVFHVAAEFIRGIGTRRKA